MDQEEYDRLYKGKPLGNHVIDVDSQTVTPRITVVNSSPQDLANRRHDALAENEVIVGYTRSGVPLVRRSGGYDYAGTDAWRQMMARCGRLRR
jgi:hypothetical protein